MHISRHLREWWKRASSFFEQGKQGRISDKMLLLLRKVSVKVSLMPNASPCAFRSFSQTKDPSKEKKKDVTRKRHERV
jgi:G:T/U-mismatch repair DNA glycosylase